MEGKGKQLRQWKESSLGPLTPGVALTAYSSMSLFFTCKTGTILQSNQSPLGEAHVKRLPSARHTIGAQRPTAIVTQGLEWDPDLPSFTTLRETLAALSDLFAK